MADKIDPELLKFLKSLPPQVRELLMQNIVKQSRAFAQDGQQGIFTPGENGSTVIPRQGPMQEPTLLQALDNKRRQRSKAIMAPNIDNYAF